MKICQHCKQGIAIKDRAGRRDVCPECGWDLHICLNCKFYDERVHNKCREPQSEWVSNREKSNFCDYFVFKDSKEDNVSRGEESNEKFNALFGK